MFLQGAFNMTEFPKRKNIRLKDFDYSQNGCYFITICTHKRQKLFGEIVGETLCGLPCKMIEKWFNEIENKFTDVKICDYVVMPDHVHFIISKTGDHMDQSTGDHIGSPLPDIVGWFKTMTTNEYIKRVKEQEYLPFYQKVWQRGYYEHIIRDENDYMVKSKYIMNNIYKKSDN